MEQYFDFAAHVETPEESQPSDLSLQDGENSDLSSVIVPCGNRRRPPKQIISRLLSENELMLLRVCMAGWLFVKNSDVNLLSRLTDTCVYMIERRERVNLSLGFNGWLRQLDDRRMGRAALRIRHDGEQIKTLAATNKHQDRKSEYLLELLTRYCTCVFYACLSFF